MTVLAEWEAPAWAGESSQDESAVVHVWELSVLKDLDGEEVSVVLIQRDEMEPAPAVVARAEPHVIVGRCITLSADQAEELGLAMVAAAKMLRT